MHVCDHVYRPSIRLDAVRHRSSNSRGESSLSKTLEQIALALLTHVQYIMRRVTTIGPSYIYVYVRIVSIAIDEIISAAGNRVIDMFRGERGVFA